MPQVPRLPESSSTILRPRRSSSGWLLRSLAIAVVLFTAVLVYLRTFQLPAPTGSYPVGTTILHLTDPSRNDPYSPDRASRRELVVQLWYPAAPSRELPARYVRWREAGTHLFYGPLLRTHSRPDIPVASSAAPFTVLLFAPRWGGRRTQNTALIEDLASHGYVVASIDFPHNAARVQMADGSVVRGNQALQGPKAESATAQEQIGFWNATLQLWVADERFILDQLAAKSANPRDPFHGRLDTAHAGAFGHSFGGAAALALCGVDPRIQAAANLDGWTFGALRNRTVAQHVLLFYEGISRAREQQLATLASPGATEDQLDREDFAGTEASLSAHGGYRLFLAGTQHMDFSDEPLLPPFRRLTYTGPTAPLEVNSILRQTVLQFFDQSLRGRQSPLLQPGRSPFPELTVERWTAATPTETRR